jgi:membrane protease YdiL (CAAX protease family)
MKPLWIVPLVVVTIGAASYFAFVPARAETPWVWLIMVGPTIVFAGVGALLAHKEGDLGTWLKPRWGDFTRAFLGALLLFGGAYAAARVVMPSGSPRALWLFSLYSQLGAQRLATHAPLVALAIVVAAIGEEVTWRGFVTSLLEERLGSRHAWLGSAALYGLAHVPSMWALRSPLGALNPVLPAAAIACGLVWGAMARAFGGRLAPSILSHALFDWCVLMMFPLWTFKQA